MKRLILTATVALTSAALMACSTPAATTPSPSAAVDPGGLPATQAVIVAKNVDFTPKAVTLASGVPVRLVFQNDDGGVPHNLHVTGGGQDVVKSEIVTGPATLNLDIGPLQPGGYSFVCDVHPNMTGTIDVKAP